MDDGQFRELIDRFDLSWEGYRRVRKGVKKRLRRHMQMLECARLVDYFERLDEDPDVELVCRRLLTVSVSRFFRDCTLWRILMCGFLEVLTADRDAPFVVWSAGCASGEEVYSFRMVWEEMRRFGTPVPPLTVLGTDLNPTYLIRCRTGIYSPGSIREIPRVLRKRYMKRQPESRRYRVLPKLQQNISWMVHNLTDPPPGPFADLIFLRNNLLTYYNPSLKIPAFHRIVDTLASPGALVIGDNETLPDRRPELVRHPACDCLYFKGIPPEKAARITPVPSC